MLDALQIEIHFQPVLSAGATSPLGWHAQASVGGASYAATAAALPPELRGALQAQRIERLFEAAIAVGVRDSGALLIVPVCAAADMPDRVLAHLFRTALLHRFPTDRVVVEVSADERADRAQAAALIHACGCRGLMVGLDAFAAGPVALGLLAHFTPRLVRLDPMLVRHLDRSASRRCIVESVVRLAHGMGVTVIAQDMQQRAELNAATALGICHFQGEGSASILDIQPLPNPQPPRREPRSTQPAHRRLAHHQRANHGRTGPASGGAMQAAI